MATQKRKISQNTIKLQQMIAILNDKQDFLKKSIA
jgi:hypothetical protein